MNQFSDWEGTSVSKHLQIVKDEDDENLCEETARPRELKNME